MCRIKYRTIIILCSKFADGKQANRKVGTYKTLSKDKEAVA